jgi:DcaP outer membrane protein
LRALEATVQLLQTQLATERARAAQTPITLPPAAETRVAALETRVAAIPAEGFKIGTGTVRLNGILKVEGLFSSFNDGPVPAQTPGGTTSREFYIPSATPVGGNGGDTVFNSHAKQTRLMLTATQAIAGHTLSAYVEADFESAAGSQGTQNVSNAYDFAVRRAFLTYDKWTIGQDWTTFLNLATLPESTDFIGSTDGTVFARQPLVRYTTKLSDAVTLQLAAENPETVTSSAGGPAGGQDDDFFADVVARLNIKAGMGDFVFGALVRRLQVQDAATSFDETATGWGLSVSGKIPFGTAKRNDVRFMLTTGEGLGRYLGIGFAADAVAVAAGPVRELKPIGVTAGLINGRVFLTDRTRMTAGWQFQTVNNKAGLTAGTANNEAWSAFVNLFFRPVKGLDLGVEYRHAERETYNGLDGSLDRLHLVAKQSF